MAILLLLLLVAAGLLVGDVALENTTATTITVAGREFGGLSLGGWMLAFAVLGFVSAYFVLGMLAAARRGRVRRRALRSSEREMADRVAELERENIALRGDTPATGDGGAAPEQGASSDTLVDTPAHRDEMGRRLAPPTAAHAAAPDTDHVRDHPLARGRDGDKEGQLADRTSDRA